jgi:hypothetical protein
MSRVQENNPHAAPSLQSEKLHARHLHNSPLKIRTKLLPRRGGYMHQYLAHLVVTTCVLSMECNKVKIHIFGLCQTR